jgi:3D-(3,5/4)-trihydroxycyclohexane-1,2-dione acylhydrolase (decyclizing)
MLSSDLVTAIQEGFKLVVVIWDNSGYKSIGSLSRSLGQDGFGTRFTYPQDGKLTGDSAGETARSLPIDLAMNARSLGAQVIECQTYEDYTAAIATASKADRTTVIVIRNDRYESVVAEVSDMPAVQAARAVWEKMRKKERFFF